MIQRVNFNMFTDKFTSMGRGEQFSYAGLKALYDYYTSLEDDLGEDIELDVIGVCCEWVEYANEEEMEAETALTRRELEQETLIIELPTGGILVYAF